MSGLPNSEKLFVPVPATVAEEVRRAAIEQRCSMGAVVRNLLIDWCIARDTARNSQAA